MAATAWKSMTEGNLTDIGGTSWRMYREDRPCKIDQECRTGRKPERTHRPTVLPVLGFGCFDFCHPIRGKEAGLAAFRTRAGPNTGDCPPHALSLIGRFANPAKLRPASFFGTPWLAIDFIVQRSRNRSSSSTSAHHGESGFLLLGGSLDDGYGWGT